jgi:hypothetical protein
LDPLLSSFSLLPNMCVIGERKSIKIINKKKSKKMQERDRDK